MKCAHNVPIVKHKNKSTDTRHIDNNFIEKQEINLPIFFNKNAYARYPKINVQINDKTTLKLKWSNGIVTKLFHFTAKSISH